MNYTYLDIAKMIDHSLLNPTLTASDLEQGIQLARRTTWRACAYCPTT